jgi:hypothetical protein
MWLWPPTAKFHGICDQNKWDPETSVMEGGGGD